MALVTSNQFQLIPQTAQAVSSGLQLGQQIRGIQQQRQQQQQQLGIQNQVNELSQKAAAGDLQSLNQLSVIDPQRAQQLQQFQATQQENRFKSIVRGAQELQLIPTTEGKIDFLEKRKRDLPASGITNTEDTDAVLDAFKSGNIDAGNSLIDRAVQAGINSGLIEQPLAEKSFTLSPGQKRFGPGGKVIAEVSPKIIKDKIDKKIEIPPVLLSGLDPEIAEKGSAAFSAAGGGKDGLKAFQSIIDKGTEQQKKLASPAIIKNSFPRASPAETVQLQSAMDASKTTEAGLEAAAKVRKEQKRTKKAQAFQVRAVELLDNILENNELDDVLGSIEGSIDFRLQDSESELIADIEEATNILTADNMDLMSGVLSESDIKILKSLSGGALNRKRTEERFRSDVGTIRDKLSSQKVVTVDEQQAARDQTNQLQEGQIIRNPATGERMQVVNGQLVGI